MATLEDNVYERARLARDARFDGQFFVGVRTTGIYCRPICPANAPKRENVTFFPSAAAASEAGFRPCLRCRPETAPGSPAWSGTSTTVRRGLRLIAGGALDDGDVETLAARLGVTSRHLRRLFTEHVGASPRAVAHTQRLHFAKRLIDETSLPMRDVSVAAGYGSVRRFNDAFKKSYGRSPRDLRKVRKEPVLEDSALTVRLPYRQPFSWDALLAFFRDRATPGVEAVHDDCYTRTLGVDGAHGVIKVAPADTPGFLSLTLTGMATTSLFGVVQRAREVFDLDAPVGDIHAVLASDAALADRLGRLPGVRVPGAWDGFELAVRAILGQQVSVAAATTLAGRIVCRYGVPLALSDEHPADSLRVLFPTPERLARARMNGMGLTQSRIDTIRALARAVVRGELDFGCAQPIGEFCRKLQSIKGIGDWTAQYVAMRALKHPDAFPASDLGLMKAIDMPRRVSPTTLRARAEAWRPWRAYAALLLWQAAPGAGG